MSIKYRDIFRHANYFHFSSCESLLRKLLNKVFENVKQENGRHGIESKKEEKEQLRMKIKETPEGEGHSRPQYISSRLKCAKFLRVLSPRIFD